MNSQLFPWYVFFTVLSFVWGACVGSFLNVCIYRMPRELSVIKPRSFCPCCNRAIPWFCNIPLISLPALRARCRYCGGKISFRYFLVELLTAVLFLLIWFKFDPLAPLDTVVSGAGNEAGSRFLWLVPVTDWKLVLVYWLAVAGLVVGTFIDFEHLIIPDRVTLGGIAAGLVLSAVVPALHGEKTVLWSLLWSVIGAASGWAVLWAIAGIGKLIFRKEAMGFGDVKLLGAIGAFLGWKAVLFTILISSLVGSIVGISLVIFSRKNMQSRIPYGPYLALAAVVWILWGANILNGYINLLIPSMP